MKFNLNNLLNGKYICSMVPSALKSGHFQVSLASGTRLDAFCVQGQAGSGCKLPSECVWSSLPESHFLTPAQGGAQNGTCYSIINASSQGEAGRFTEIPCETECSLSPASPVVTQQNAGRPPPLTRPGQEWAF